MKKVYYIILICLIITLPLVFYVIAEPPVLLCRYYGSVRLSGQYVTPGVSVSAWVGGVQIAESTVRVDSDSSVYVIDVPGDDPDTPGFEGASPGNYLVFKIRNIEAIQTAEWIEGEFTKVHLSANPPPSSPIADDQSIFTDEDTPIDITLFAFDPNMDPLTYTIITNPSKGILIGTPPNLTYTPTEDCNGSDSFTFKANDGTDDSNTGTITITINPAQDPPELLSISDQVIYEGIYLEILISAFDPDGDIVVLSVADLPDFGNFTDNGDGTGLIMLSPGYDDAGFYQDVTATATDGIDIVNDVFSITVIDGVPVPKAQFTTSKGMNVALLGDPGVEVVNCSSGSPSVNQAIDGKMNTRWSSDNGLITNQWIKVKLRDANVNLINKVNIRCKRNQSRIRDFELRVSASGTDDSDFITVYSGTLPYEEIDSDNQIYDDEYEFMFPIISAKYVQLYIFNNWGDYYIGLYDFQVRTREREGGILSLKEGPPLFIVDFSSQSGSQYPPSKILDNQPKTYWRTSSNTNEWIKLVLPGNRIHLIDCITFSSYYQQYLTTNTSVTIKDFEIRISTANSHDSSFTTIFSGTAEKKYSTQSFSFPPVEAKYLQLFIHNNYGGSTIYVDEFDVFDTDGQNLTNPEGIGGRIVEHSSGSTPENAIDYSTGNSWETASGDISDQWIKVELLSGKSYLIDRIVLRGPDNDKAPKDFMIRVSNDSLDDADFITVFSGSLSIKAIDQWFIFEPVECKYVQLYILNNYGNTSTIQVKNFRVYSPALGGTAVPFIDHSIYSAGDIISWSWNFGDGQTSTDQHPLHTYNLAGTYQISLTITGFDGSTDTAVMDYTVLKPPQFDIVWTPEIPNEGETTILDYNWISGHSIMLNMIWQAEHQVNGLSQCVFPDDGEYHADLTVFDSQFITHAVSDTITVLNLPPTVDIPDDTLYLGKPIVITPVVSDPGSADIPTMSYLWELWDGSTVTQENLEYPFKIPGEYQVNLTINDNDGGIGVDSTTLIVVKRPLILTYIGERIQDRGQEVTLKAIVKEIIQGDPVPGIPVYFSLGSLNTIGTTDTNGVAEVNVLFNDPSGGYTINTTVPEDSNYLACSITKSFATGDQFHLVLTNPIEKGLDYLAVTQNDNGFWSSIDEAEAVGYTGLVVLAYETYAALQDFDSFDPDYIYNQQIRSGLNYIFSKAAIKPISVQPAGNPDSDGDGIGINIHSQQNREMYETGIAAMTIVASNHPEMVVDITNTEVSGWTFEEIVTDMVDYISFAQGDSGSTLSGHRGGWRYSANSFENDNSVAGYVVLGLTYVESPPPIGFGMEIPNLIKSELRYWLDYIQIDDPGSEHYGGSGYRRDNSGNILRTGNLLQQLAFIGDTLGSQKIQDALSYIERFWDVSEYSPGWKELSWYNPHLQSAYTCMKGLEALGLDYIDTDGDGERDDNWYFELVSAILNSQNSDGSWPVEINGSKSELTTSWALLVLMREAPPVLKYDLTIQFTDSLFGGPIVGADVQVIGPETRTAVTDSLGYVSFSQLLVGDYTISANAVDYHPVSIDITLDVETHIRIDMMTINQKPEITPIGDQVMDEGDTLSVAVTASDPDGDELILSSSGLPDFTALFDNGNGTGELVLTPQFGECGIYESNFLIVSDGTYLDSTTFTITVNCINRSPELTDIADQVLDEGDTLTINVSATDIDNDIIIFNIFDLPAFGSMLDNGDGTGSIVIIPDFEDSGIYEDILIIASDGFLSDSVSFNITVTDVNRAPELSILENKNMNEGDTLNVTISATDPDDDSIALSVSNVPDFGVLTDHGDGTGLLNFTPDYDDGGLYEDIHVIAADGNLSDTMTFIITVNNINRSPELESINNQVVDEGDTLTISISGIDPDGDAITLSATGLPNFGILTDNGDGTGMLVFEPGYQDAGSYPGITVIASDTALSDSVSFSLTVNNLNRAPEIMTVSNQMMDEGDTLNLVISATDPDQDIIVISASNLPPFTAFVDSGNGKGLLTFMPAFDNAGEYPDIQLVAADSALTDTTTFVLTVVNVNRAPELDGIEDQEMTEGDTLNVSITAVDYDGDTVNLTVENLPDFATFTDHGTGSGEVVFMPDHEDAGFYEEIIVVASDTSLSDSISFTIIINNVNRHPTINIVQEITINEGDTLTVTGSLNDPDQDTLSVNVNYGDGSETEPVNIQQDDSFGIDHLYQDNGTYNLIITASDPYGGLGSDTLLVTVNNLPPSVGEIAATVDPQEVGMEITAAAEFTDPGVLDIHNGVWDWGDSTTSSGIITETGGSGTVTGSQSYMVPGVYTIHLTVTDKDMASSDTLFEYIVIFSPDSGFVTGGGWINSPVGAYTPNPQLTGKASFGFVAKYKKGANVPTGNTQFQFHVAKMTFKSTEYQWLVVAGAKAKFKGFGIINQQGDYGFMLTGVDGELPGGGGVDKFRIKIWERATDEIIYDNEIGADDDAEPTTAIAGGNIVIHKD